MAFNDLSLPPVLPEFEPIAVKFALEAVNKGMETSLAGGLLLESTLLAICASTEDKKEGTSAFLEKRAPNWSGK